MLDKNLIPITTEQLKSLPQMPGVYLMRDASNQVLYVGKAKNIRLRVQSYFRGGDNRPNVPYLLASAESVETLVTENERQAILLENDLIKKYKPRYNVRLKDDKAYLLVRIDLNNEWPRLELSRRVVDDGAKYIGPFAFTYELRALLEIINRSVPLRTCSDHVLHNRIRPCLEHQIKRCAAPCCLEIDRGQYLEWVAQAVQILEGKGEGVAGELIAQMARASEELRFEDAAGIRDRLAILKQVRADRSSAQFSSRSQDAFALERSGQNVELSVLMVRRGRLFGAQTYGFDNVEVGSEEFLSSVLTQFYQGAREIPEVIVLPWELEDIEARSELYTETSGRVVQITAPMRGSKRRLLNLAQANALENFSARWGRADKAIEEFKKTFALDEMPRTIECVDISHFQGGETVASVVCFRDGAPQKERYRHFHLPEFEKPDDVGSIREVVKRHLSRSAEENGLSEVMVIDGGRAQLAAAREVRDALGLERPLMIGLAKRRAEALSYQARRKQSEKPERAFLEAAALTIVLEPGSQVFRLITRIRDEAHRFAISFHRKTRTNKAFRSKLDGIQGVGPKRRQALLRTFGSVKGIREASAEDIHERCQIPLRLAERILEKLRVRTSE